MAAHDDQRGQSDTLGACPICNTQLPSSSLLIRYKTADGWPRMFAECPTCDEPVHPT